jgi:pentatricopeptide repeat protein
MAASFRVVFVHRVPVVYRLLVRPRSSTRKAAYAIMTIGVKLEQEPVPANKRYMISTRENSEYKWQNDSTLLGALEVPSDPYFRLDGEYNSRPVAGKEGSFDKALEVWEQMNLRQEFQKAAESGPKST